MEVAVSSQLNLFHPAPSQMRSSEAREQQRVVLAAQAARLHEQARIVLAHDALEGSALLSALEAQYLQVAPLGEARYKAIVDAFTLSTTNAIARW